MYLKQSLSNINKDFAFVFIIYISTIVITAFVPVFMIIIFAFILQNTFLALRIGIISLIALINNQFVLSGIINYFYQEKTLHMYVSGMLFYFIILGLLKFFSKINLTKELRLFLILTLIVFFMSYQNIFKSMLFLLNVVGGFLALFILINSLLNYFNYKNIQKFNILKRDFFYTIVVIVILSLAIIFIDLSTNFIYLKFQAQSLASFRGDGIVKLTHGIPQQYITGFLGIDFLIRYTSLINDPVRAAYWYLYLFLFLIKFRIDKNIKIIMLFLLFLFLLNCWSKGSFLSVIFVFIFYYLYKYKLYKFSIFFFIFISITFIYLSIILKSSAAVHVLGLLLPFQANIDIHYFFGNNFFQAGNMGRIPGEHWMNSVTRGAESLVGTYMYAYGLIGVFIYLLIHYKTIKLLNKCNLYLVASLITVSLFISFLQEGNYNVMQVFPLSLLTFFLIGQEKIKREMYANSKN